MIYKIYYVPTQSYRFGNEIEITDFNGLTL